MEGGGGSHADHYSKVADVYDSAWCHQEGGAASQHVSKQVISFMPEEWLRPGRPGPPPRICDLGCGTGSFTALLQRDLQAQVQEAKAGAPAGEVDDACSASFVCVEPAARMAELASQRGFADVQVCGADEWASGIGDKESLCDFVLLKEMVHHLGSPGEIYARLVCNRLRAGGRLLIITRGDSSEGIYPFPAAAHATWAKGVRVTVAEHVEALQQAGLSDVQVEKRPFRVHMPRKEWARLLRARFWSNLSEVSDADMEEGISAMELDAAPDEMIEFDDAYTFISGQKVEMPPAA